MSARVRVRISASVRMSASTRVIVGKMSVYYGEEEQLKAMEVV